MVPDRADAPTESTMLVRPGRRAALTDPHGRPGGDSGLHAPRVQALVVGPAGGREQGGQEEGQGAHQKLSRKRPQAAVQRPAISPSVA